MEQEIDWKNAKFNPKRSLGGMTEEQSTSEFTKYCQKNLAEAEAKLTSLDYDKTLALLDSFGITDIAVANRILTACKEAQAASERKKEVDQEKPLLDFSTSEETAKPKAHEPHEAPPLAKLKIDYTEEMREFKQLEEDFLGHKL